MMVSLLTIGVLEKYLGGTTTYLTTHMNRFTQSLKQARNLIHGLLAGHALRTEFFTPTMMNTQSASLSREDTNFTPSTSPQAKEYGTLADACLLARSPTAI